MSQVQELLTDYLDIWTAAEAEKKSGRGRSTGSAGKVYGVQKLRSLILDLAVRGKLVPQDANDEPASDLLKNIQAQKAKLIAEGALKKEKPLAPIADDEKLFDLPKGWVWARLGASGKIFNGNSINEQEKQSKFTNLREGFPFIATKDVGFGRDDLDYDNGVLIPFDNHTFKVAHKNAILICSEGGSAGKKIGLTNTDICFGNKLYANETWDGINPRFIFYLYQSPPFFKSFSNRMTGIIGGISISEFLSIPIPIPSSHEQDRISSKLDELMMLCDQLEQQHSNAQEAREHLVSILLCNLTKIQNANEFQNTWQCIAEHFDSLFTTEASVEELEQNLLQLAIMGKLVPQSPSDEPANELIKRIQADKIKLTASGKIKKDKGLEPITEKEKPFELPVGWEWIKCQDVCLKITDGEHATPKRSKSGYYLLSARNVTNKGILLDDVDYVPHDEFERIRGRCDPNIGDILISCSGSVGRVALVDKNDMYSMVRSAAMIRPANNFICKEYIAILLRSPYVQEQIRGRSKQAAQANLFLGAISNLVLVLPPLAEQHRIVAKVDELMALCDELKTHIQQASQHQQQLADVLVVQALN